MLRQAHLYWIQVIMSTSLPCQVSAVTTAFLSRVMQHPMQMAAQGSCEETAPSVHAIASFQ